MDDSMIRKISFLLLVVIGIFLHKQVLAQPSDRFSNVSIKYDRDGNGKLDAEIDVNGDIDPRSELAIYLLHQRSSVLQEFDTDFNGELSGDEIRELNKKAKEGGDFEQDLADAKDHICENSTDSGGCESQREITIGKINVQPKSELEETETVATSGFFIRNAYSSTSLLSEIPKSDAASLRSVSPASFSYTRDNQAGSDQLAVSGAISKYRRWSYRGERKSLPNLQALAISGGVVFDRTISSAEDANETDTLAVRFDIDTVFQGWPVFDTHFLTLSSTLTSDFSFDSALLTSGIRWQPVHNNLAIGGVAYEFEVGDLPFAFLWQPSLEFEYQYVADDGGRAQLQEADDFLFFGPLLNAQLFFDFKPFNGAFLNLDYRVMEDVLDNTSSFDFLELSLNIPLDVGNHYLLNFRFRDGNLPTTRQEVDDFLIGLGVRF